MARLANFLLLAILCLNALARGRPDAAPLAALPALGSTLRLPPRWERKWSSVSCFYADSNGREFSDAQGLADREKNVRADSVGTAYMLASVSKLVTHTALLMLWDQKKFQLDDDVSDYLGYRVRNPNFKSKKITFRHFLTHTSGMKSLPPHKFVDYMYAPEGAYLGSGRFAKGNEKCPIDTTLEDFFNEYLRNVGECGLGGKKWFFNDKTPWSSAAPPGAREMYSNLGVAFEALLVEAISKKPFREFTKTFIFDVLDMKHTAWDFKDIVGARTAKPYPPTRRGRFRAGDSKKYCFVDYPNGGLWSTSSDFSKFLKGTITPGVLYSNQTMVEIFKCQSPKCRFGLGWGIEKGKPMHDGSESGWASLVFARPDYGYVYGCFANSEPRLDRLARTVLESGKACGFYRVQEQCDLVSGCGWHRRLKKCVLKRSA